MSPLYSWLLVGACLLAAVGVAALLQAIRRPATMVELAPELRGPARGEPWTLGEKLELAAVVLGVALGVALFALGPTIDRWADERVAARVAAAEAQQ